MMAGPESQSRLESLATRLIQGAATDAEDLAPFWPLVLGELAAIGFSPLGQMTKRVLENESVPDDYQMLASDWKVTDAASAEPLLVLMRLFVPKKVVSSTAAYTVSWTFALTVVPASYLSPTAVSLTAGMLTCRAEQGEPGRTPRQKVVEVLLDRRSEVCSQTDDVDFPAFVRHFAQLLSAEMGA